MRILNVTQTYFPFLEFGGPPVKVRSLSQQLAKLGHHVTVLTADWGLKSRAAAAAAAVESGGERSALGWQLEESGIEAIYLPTWLHYRALSWNPGIARFCRTRLWNFDVVHIFGLYDFLGPAVAAACRRSGIPYVVEPIGMFMPIVRNFLLKRMYHLALGQRMLRGSRKVIATSPQEVAELASSGLPAEKILVRRNGVEVPETLPDRGKFRASAGIPENAKVILYLGRLSEKKSPDVLLQAFALLCKAKSDAELRLVFAGPDDDGMKEKLLRMAGELGVSSSVQIRGAAYGEQKWNAYTDADVFVLPSQSENFGNTAGEAVAAGTPVVVTDKCGVAPLLADVAGLVVAHDAAAMAQALARVLWEPGLHARLTAGCRKVAARLDWDEPAQEMENLYEQLVKDEKQTAELLH
ncbi:MAG TPA: glycosyltransferase [Candidatus Acidoferrum sp.]|nr:glycosyltransferase [Candidatus Acidoferrum sp.]